MLCEPNVFYQDVQDSGTECKSSRASRISTPVFYSYTKDKVQSEAGLENDLTQNEAGDEHRVISLRVLLLRALFFLIERLVYP